MKMLRKLALTAVAAIGFSVGQAEASVMLTTNGQNFNFNWNLNTINGPITGNGSMTATGFGTTDLKLSISVTNTGQGRLGAFAFGINPNATTIVDQIPGGGANAGTQVGDGSGSDTDSLKNAVFGTVGGGAAYTAIEVCATSGNTCQGGGGTGLSLGQTDAFFMVLQQTSLAIWTYADVGPLALKYQAVGATQTFGGNSYHFTTDEPCSEQHTEVGFCSVDVPEPNSLSLLLVSILSMLGFGYLGLGRRARA